jgi:exosortase N
MAGLHAQTEGNLILVNGAPFAVDDACMGLNLLSVSMLMGVFILSHQYRKGKVELGWLSLTVFFFVVFVMNIVCNLLRIIILVGFEIAPESPMHDGIGILCFIAYVVVPLWFLANRIIGRCGRTANVLVKRPFFSTLSQRAFIGGLAVVVVWLGFHIEAGHRRNDALHSQAKMAGFVPRKIAGGVLRMYDGELLVYIKPIPEFFSSEHTPLICWIGSGYQFGSVK